MPPDTLTPVPRCGTTRRPHRRLTPHNPLPSKGSPRRRSPAPTANRLPGRGTSLPAGALRLNPTVRVARQSLYCGKVRHSIFLCPPLSSVRVLLSIIMESRLHLGPTRRRRGGWRCRPYHHHGPSQGSSCILTTSSSFSVLLTLSSSGHAFGIRIQRWAAQYSEVLPIMMVCAFYTVSTASLLFEEA